ncbi:MAG: M56 family metallopeptidase [Chloroflexi bacterium]|nr:M56 family metallopeptidase [Chloroflexota bacterium]
MHTLLGLSSVMLVVLGGYLALGVQRGLGAWSRRRDLQFLVLAAPVVSLALGVAGLHHFADRTCFLGAPPWDTALGVALPLGMSAIALGGLGLGVVRLALLDRTVARRGAPADPALQALAHRLADDLGAPRADVRLWVSDRPLALTCGLWRPTLLLSSWLLEHLDGRELEAVLAHELAHVVRRDYPIIWLATVLRDAFCYLPTSWAAYRQLQLEKELACDDLAIGVTRRPLALAGALAKVWQRSAGGPTFGAAQPLVEAGKLIEDRIERLLAAPAPPQALTPTRCARHPSPVCGRGAGGEGLLSHRLDGSAPRSGRGNGDSRGVALGVGAAALVGLLAVEATNVAVMLAPMGCGPVGTLTRLLS